MNKDYICHGEQLRIIVMYVLKMRLKPFKDEASQLSGLKWASIDTLMKPSYHDLVSREEYNSKKNKHLIFLKAVCEHWDLDYNKYFPDRIHFKGTADYRNHLSGINSPIDNFVVSKYTIKLMEKFGLDTKDHDHVQALLKDFARELR